MPTQDSFDPMLYLAIMHGETSLSDLKTGQQNLSFEVSERTGQLKDLVSNKQGSGTHTSRMLAWLLSASM